MTEKEFSDKILELMVINADPRNSADEDILNTMMNEVIMRNGGQWGDGMARQVMTEFEFVLEQAKKS